MLEGKYSERERPRDSETDTESERQNPEKRGEDSERPGETGRETQVHQDAMSREWDLVAKTGSSWSRLRTPSPNCRPLGLLSAGWGATRLRPPPLE